MKILNFGSLNIDMVYTVDHFVRKGETISCASRRLFPGGKGLNQSVALGRAGADVWHAGLIGKDGVFLKELLEESGVHTDYLFEDPENPTGHAIIQRTPSGDNGIIICGGANEAVSRAMIDRVLASFDAGDWIVLQNEISNVEYIIDRASQKGMKVFFNPSPLNDRIQMIDLGKVGCLFVNEVEAAGLVGSSDSDTQEVSVTGADAVFSFVDQASAYEELAHAMHNKFPETDIVLTLGGSGSVFIPGNSDHFIRQEIFPVKAVDTTAAGDTFTGYFVASLAKGSTVQEALRIASMASSIAVGREGASPSIPYYSEVEAKLAGK